MASPLEHVVPARLRPRTRPRRLRHLCARHRPPPPPRHAPAVRETDARDQTTTAGRSRVARTKDVVGGRPHRAGRRRGRLESGEHSHALHSVPSEGHGRIAQPAPPTKFERNNRIVPRVLKS